jgi:flagellar biosynthesis protein FliR
MITVSLAPLTTLFLVAIRTGMVLILSPIEAIRLLPIHTRLILMLIISGLITSNLSFSETLPTNETSLLLCGLSECCNGLILSLGIYAAFGVFQIAGLLMDTQMGLNAMAIFNPGDHTNDPMSSRLLTMLAVLFFFAINGHHKLIQGLALSFATITPGKLILFNGLTPILQQFSLMFTLSLMIASPIVTGLLIIDIASAVLTRNMPQMNTYFLVLPIKILLGLLLFSLLLTYLNPLMDKGFELCFQAWARMMT